MPFRPFGSHHIKPPEPQEDATQVTKLFDEIDERISSSAETMNEAVSKAGKLERRLRGKKSSQQRLKAAMRASSVPPPPTASAAANGD